MAEVWDGNPEELNVQWSLPWNEVIALEKLFAQPGNEKFAWLIQTFQEARDEALAEAEEERAHKKPSHQWGPWGADGVPQPDR